MSRSPEDELSKVRESKDQFIEVDDMSMLVESAKKSAAYSRRIERMSSVKFHKILKQLMESKKISSRALAKELKMPHSTLASYLTGKKASYSADHIGLIANYFKVSSDFLLFGKQNPLAALNELTTEGLFEGWLKVKIERAIPSKIKEGEE